MTPAPISVDGAPAKVHRYDPRITPNPKTGRVDYDGMAAFPNGKWVLHSDYAALLRQLAELEAEVERLRTQHSRMVAEAAESYSKATAAERAREESAGLLRRVNASLYLLDKPHREFGGVTDKTATDIAAFLAASGGSHEPR